MDVLQEGDLVAKKSKIGRVSASYTGECGQIIRVDSQGIMIEFPDRTEILEYSNLLNDKNEFLIKDRGDL